MIRAALVLLTVGFVGFAVSNLVFWFLLPILGAILKIAIFVCVGYLILRLVKPEMAENLKQKVTKTEA